MTDSKKNKELEKEVERQLRLISMGTEEIIPLDDMRGKIRKSIESRKPLVVKLGVDPTRPDLHIGHCVPLTKLAHFQELGHRVVLIIGDFTALVGDPSEQDTTRPVLTPQEVERNARTYIDQARKVIDVKRIRIVRNSHWLKPLTFKEVLELTSNFTVARILERDDFSRRYQEGRPLRLHEFLYPVMQAYDSVVLHADVEVGGTDQKFNLLTARDLQRSMGQEPQCIITLPLLEGIDGSMKMSKSLGNDVALTDSPREMFGKVMSIPDGLIWKYFRLATKVSAEEIERMEKEVSSGELNPRDAKERLAKEIVAIYHDKSQAEAAVDEFKRVFAMGGLPGEIQVARVSSTIFKENRVWIARLLVELGLVPSKSEARRLVESGGISINGKKIADPEQELAREEIEGKIIRKGKKTFLKIEIET